MISLKLIAASLVTVNMYACTSTLPYPENWPAIDTSQSEGCAKFNGTYNNFDGKNYLSDLFSIQDVVVNEEQQVRLIIKEENKLEATVIQDDKEITKQSITAKEHSYSCEDGGIYLESKREYFIDSAVFATSLAEIRLKTAEDQSIIAEVKHKSLSMVMLLLPVRNNNIVWKKWEKID